MGSSVTVKPAEPVGSLIVTMRRDGPVYEAKWRRAGKQIKRVVGPAWLEGDGSTWRPRRGRVPEGCYDERRATIRMSQMIAEHEAGERAIEADERERRERGVTFRESRPSGSSTFDARRAPSPRLSATVATCSPSPAPRTAGAAAAALA